MDNGVRVHAKAVTISRLNITMVNGTNGQRTPGVPGGINGIMLKQCKSRPNGSKDHIRARTMSPPTTGSRKISQVHHHHMLATPLVHLAHPLTCRLSMQQHTLSANLDLQHPLAVHRSQFRQGSAFLQAYHQDIRKLMKPATRPRSGPPKMLHTSHARLRGLT